MEKFTPGQSQYKVIKIECRKKAYWQRELQANGIECGPKWGVQKIAAVWLPPGCEVAPDHAPGIHRN